MHDKTSIDHGDLDRVCEQPMVVKDLHRSLEVWINSVSLSNTVGWPAIEEEVLGHDDYKKQTAI